MTLNGILSSPILILKIGMKVGRIKLNPFLFVVVFTNNKQQQLTTTNNNERY